MPDTETALIRLSEDGFVIVKIRDGAVNRWTTPGKTWPRPFGKQRVAAGRSWMVGNVYLRIARPGIPTQLFDDESRAAEWLIGHRQ